MKKSKYRLVIRHPGRVLLDLIVAALIVAGIVFLARQCGKRPDPEESVTPVLQEESLREQDSLKGTLSILDLPEQLEIVARAMMDINRDNYEKDPELPPSEIRYEAGYRYLLVICPGHGGIDSGSVNETLGLYEKDINLSLALALRDYIEKNCSFIKVILTRTDDTLLSYREQAAIANSEEADFCLLIHANSYYGVGVARGVEAMYQFLGDEDSVSRSDAMACALTAACASILGSSDRGITKSNSLEIGLTMANCLVEVGFLSDNDEAAKISSAEYRAKLAEAIGNVLIEQIATYPVRVEE